MPFGPKELKEIPMESLRDIRPLDGMPGYFINSDGEVFCIRKLSQSIDDDGYARISVSLGGKRKHCGVHILLAKTYLGDPLAGQTEVRHLDGNPFNNSVSNLAWGTRAENAADMARHGTVRGEQNPRAILTEEIVRSILEDLDRGFSCETLARWHRVSTSAVKAIRERRNWKHVSCEATK